MANAVSNYLLHVNHAPRPLFVEAYPHWFLCSMLNVPPDSQAYFDTELQHPITPEELAVASQQDTLDLELLHIFPLRKEHPDSEAKLSLGRATTNDIVIPHLSVSKLHAHLILREDQVFVRDAGSRNGTRINNQSVAPEATQAIGVGDVLTFGGQSLELLGAGELYDLLEPAAQRNGGRR